MDNIINNSQTPVNELNNRMLRFRNIMDLQHPGWEMAVIFGKINQYYFTGTMQEGMLLIPRNDVAVFWVRRSYERACDESLFPNIKPMDSFRDAALTMHHLPKTVYIETELVPLAMYQRFQKYFPFENFKSLDNQISVTRSLKSNYELDLMKQSGKIHERVLEQLVPQILKEGMSEVDLAVQLYQILIAEGHHGVTRFGMFDTEVLLGHVAFGESSLYPTSFNGPGGNYGLSAAVPLLGNREHKLKKGDLVFIDIGCGVNGYHTDKTMTYMFGQSLPQFAIEAHGQCVDIQNDIAKRLVPGAIPSEIYKDIIEKLSPDFLNNFMGFGSRQVKFLGHGIGLTIDELPVIAKGFDNPIEENMVFALEPKKGIEGIGMVGIENTFIVSKSGGYCITGNSSGLIPVF